MNTIYLCTAVWHSRRDRTISRLIQSGKYNNIIKLMKWVVPPSFTHHLILLLLSPTTAFHFFIKLVLSWRCEKFQSGHIKKNQLNQETPGFKTACYRLEHHYWPCFVSNYHLSTSHDRTFIPTMTLHASQDESKSWLLFVTPNYLVVEWTVFLLYTHSNSRTTNHKLFLFHFWFTSSVVLVCKYTQFNNKYTWD